MTRAQRIARLQRELYPDLAVLLRELQQPVPPPEGECGNGLPEES